MGSCLSTKPAWARHQRRPALQTGGSARSRCSRAASSTPATRTSWLRCSPLQNAGVDPAPDHRLALGGALAVSQKIGGVLGPELATFARRSFVSGLDLAVTVGAVVVWRGRTGRACRAAEPECQTPARPPPGISTRGSRPVGTELSVRPGTSGSRSVRRSASSSSTRGSPLRTGVKGSPRRPRQYSTAPTVSLPSQHAS